MSTRYPAPSPISKERADRFVALTSRSAQLPMVEITEATVRIWTMYDYQREHGTYMEIWRDGLVTLVTVQPSGKRDSSTLREPDRVRRIEREEEHKVRTPKRKPKRSRVANRF